MKKITIIGDIVCDKEMLKHAKINKNQYNFDKMFAPLYNYFKDSDYVIANLESVIDNNNYTNSIFSFSNPYSLLTVLKRIGISAVSLANNHILDRNEEGIKKTIFYLNKAKIDYFGIRKENDNGILNIKLEDVNISVLGYTDSTNYHINKNKIENLKNYKINILRDEENSKKNLYHKLNPDFRIRLENLLGIKLKPIVDNYEIDYKYLNEIKKEVKELKDKKNYIIMYPHIGGQFNTNLGSYSKKIIKEFNNINIDSIVITHPHIIQKINANNTFSIGDLMISPRSKFVVWDSLPQYSLSINYYFDKKKLQKITISFLICVKDKKDYLKIYPFYDYYSNLNNKLKSKYKKEFKIVYKRIFNKKLEIKDEYTIREDS